MTTFWSLIIWFLQPRHRVLFLFNETVLIRTWFQLNSSHLFGSSHHTAHPLRQTSLTLSESSKGSVWLGPTGQDKSSQQVLELAPSAPGHRSSSLDLARKTKSCSSSLRPASRSAPLCHSAKIRPNPCCVLIQVHRPRKAHEAVWQTNTHKHTHTFIKRSVGTVGRDRWEDKQGGGRN